MCGIAGVITNNQNQSLHAIKKSKDIQKHRGPDAFGLNNLKINSWNIGLSHHRLAILDLSSKGNQPMSYENKGVLTFNGEIYNYVDIKIELEKLGYIFDSDTDTEVLLYALHQWGLKKTVSKLNGMWAFAWLDLQSRKLYLSRDRTGEKPLFYFYKNNELYFASEIKTVLEMSGIKFNLNYPIVGQYLFQSLLATTNETFFDGIMRLPAGHNCEINLNNTKLELGINRYWAVDMSQDGNDRSENEIISQVHDLFVSSVKMRMRSDVPIGVLLSGGVDSSAITAVMHKITGGSKNLNIISSVSDDSRFDESPFIDLVAKHLNHQVHKVKTSFPVEEAIRLLEEVCWYNDEPVGNFSNVAHYMLMQKARELGITVLLSGQGADELLCGYKKYLGFYIQSLVRKKQFSKAMSTVFEFYKNGTVLTQFSLSEAKRYLPKIMANREESIAGEKLIGYNNVNLGLIGLMTVQERQLLDVEKFSVPVLTHYEDHMSMACSREIRVPFLDHRLIELLVPLQVNYKLKHGWTKHIFRMAMENYLPKEIIWRKDKQGFVNPQSEWMRNELKELILSYFEKDSFIFQYGLVNQKNLLKKYEQYCKQETGKESIWYKEIFAPFALEIWLRKYSKYIVN